MKSFLFLLLIISSNPILSQPNLLEKAKNNPRSPEKIFLFSEK